ncbi:hypothetical protein Hanom_Chr17g01567431 [Helianthus anomalus]
MSARIATSTIRNNFFFSSTVNVALHVILAGPNSSDTKTFPVRSSSNTTPYEYTSHFGLGFRFLSDSGA